MEKKKEMEFNIRKMEVGMKEFGRIIGLMELEYMYMKIKSLI
jgi:hypothetical protein